MSVSGAPMRGRAGHPARNPGEPCLLQDAPGGEVVVHHKERHVLAPHHVGSAELLRGAHVEQDPPFAEEALGLVGGHGADPALGHLGRGEGAGAGVLLREDLRSRNARAGAGAYPRSLFRRPIGRTGGGTLQSSAAREGPSSSPGPSNASRSRPSA